MTGEFRAGHGRQRSRIGRRDQADATTARECGLPVEGPSQAVTAEGGSVHERNERIASLLPPMESSSEMGLKRPEQMPRRL
jgi:hypothetical protein